MRCLCFCVGWIVMKCIINNVLIARRDLQIVSRFKLSVLHVVFFEPHKGCIGVGSGITVSTFQYFFLLPVFFSFSCPPLFRIVYFLFYFLCTSSLPFNKACMVFTVLAIVSGVISLKSMG